MVEPRKRKGQKELPREEWVYGDCEHEVSSITVTFDPSGRVVVNEIDPSSIRRQITTAKPNGKGDRVRFSAPADHFGLELDYVEHLKTKFDYMLAVDTNTLRSGDRPARVDGYMVSACTVVIIAEPLHSWGKEVFIQPLTSYLIFDSGPDTNPELLGWHLALTKHTDTPVLRSQRVGMVVDSDLGSHIGINARKQPYYTNHQLPSNTSLIFAKSDSLDTFANHMLRYCDKVSEQILEQFEHHGVAKMLESTYSQVDTARCIGVNHPRQIRR